MKKKRKHIEAHLKRNNISIRLPQWLIDHLNQQQPEPYGRIIERALLESLKRIKNV